MEKDKENKILNVPALRFPEFTGEWIFAPLYDYLEVNRERNRNDEFDKGAVLSVSGDYGIVNQIQLLGRSFAGSSVKDYHVVRKGNIVYTKSPLKEYPYGIVKVNKGNEGIVSTLYAVYNVKHNAVGGFIESYFALPKRTNRYFKPIVRIGAKHDMKIGNEEAIANIVCFPSHAEQRKIAAFLSLLDQRISIQNKIIEDLKKLKSAIVEMILCKQGGVLLKLGDVGSFIRGLTYSSEDIAEDINATTVIRANNLSYGNNVSKKDVVYVNKKPTEIQILRKGDIVICMANGSSSLVGKNSYYSFDDRQSTIGAFCGIYRSSQPLVKWLMQSQRYRRLVYQSLQGGNGAIANLNGDDILNNVSSTNSTLCARFYYCQTVETHSCVSASCQVFAIGDFIRQSCWLRRKNASLQLFVEFTLNMTFYVVEDKKSVSILSALVLIENSIAVNEKLQELYSMQKEYLLQHLFI